MINNLVFRNVPPEARDLCRFSLDADKSLSDDDREFCREESCERTFAIGISRLGQTSRHVHAIVHAYFRWKYRNLGLRDSLNRIPSTFLLQKKSIFGFSSTRFPSKDLLSFVINIYIYVCISYQCLFENNRFCSYEFIVRVYSQTLTRGSESFRSSHVVIRVLLSRSLLAIFKMSPRLVCTKELKL